MFQFSRTPSRKVWIGTAASLVVWTGSASGREFTMLVTDADPLGLGSFVPTLLELEMGEGIKGAFSYGLGVSSVYDSNFNLSENDEESEVALYVSPWLRYISDPEGGAAVSVSANYLPSARAYLHNSNLNDVDQVGDVALTFKGSRTEVSLFGRYMELSGTDRLTGGFVTGSVATGGIRASRQIASRTSVNAGWTASVSDYGSSVNEGAEVYTTYIEGYWEASPRLSFGPSIHYTRSESGNAGTRDAWALLAQARYRVGERIWLSAGVGPEYSTTSGAAGGNDDSSLGLSANLSAMYVINERWTWMNSIDTATVPSPNETNYQVYNVALSSVLNRHLLRGEVSGGVEFNFSEYEDVGTVVTSRGNEQNMSVFLAYSRNLFSDRVAFDSEIRYSMNDGETDWSQLQISAGINVAF